MQITESVWHNDILRIKYIKEWFKNGVRYSIDFLDPELKVISRQNLMFSLISYFLK